MEDKFRSSKMIGLFAYFITICVVVFMIKVSIITINDINTNILSKIQNIILYMVFILPFILIIISVNKFYVFIGEDYIEINKLRKNTIIRIEDIIDITREDGISIRYIYGSKKKKTGVFIGSSIQGFDRIRNYLIYTFYFCNKTLSGKEVNQIDKRIFYKDKIIFSIKTLIDGDFQKYTKDYPYKANNLRVVNPLGMFKSSIIKDVNKDVVGIEFEELKQKRKLRKAVRNILPNSN